MNTDKIFTIVEYYNGNLYYGGTFKNTSHRREEILTNTTDLITYREIEHTDNVIAINDNTIEIHFKPYDDDIKTVLINNVDGAKWNVECIRVDMRIWAKENHKSAPYINVKKIYDLSV